MLLALDIDTSDHVVFAVAWILRYPLRYIYHIYPIGSSIASATISQAGARRSICRSDEGAPAITNRDESDLIRADATVSDTGLKTIDNNSARERKDIFYI